MAAAALWRTARPALLVLLIATACAVDAKKDGKKANNNNSKKDKDADKNNKGNGNGNGGIGQGNGGGQPVEFEVIAGPEGGGIPIGPTLLCLDASVQDFLQEAAGTVSIYSVCTPEERDNKGPFKAACDVYYYGGNFTADVECRKNGLNFKSNKPFDPLCVVPAAGRRPWPAAATHRADCDCDQARCSFL